MTERIVTLNLKNPNCAVAAVTREYEDNVIPMPTVPRTRKPAVSRKAALSEQVQRVIAIGVVTVSTLCIVLALMGIGAWALNYLMSTALMW